MYAPRVVFDFDGVIHSYISGWRGEEIIPDPPVKGVKQVIEKLMERGYEVIITSSRANTNAGRTAIHLWLNQYGFPNLEVTNVKPPAEVYVDDRAICFNGNCDILYKQITTFATWQEKLKEDLLQEE